MSSSASVVVGRACCSAAGQMQIVGPRRRWPPRRPCHKESGRTRTRAPSSNGRNHTGATKRHDQDHRLRARQARKVCHRDPQLHQQPRVSTGSPVLQWGLVHLCDRSSRNRARSIRNASAAESFATAAAPGAAASTKPTATSTPTAAASPTTPAAPAAATWSAAAALA